MTPVMRGHRERATSSWQKLRLKPLRFALRKGQSGKAPVKEIAGTCASEPGTHAARRFPVAVSRE